MTKESYLKELEKKLKKLPKEEKDNALAYYDEYFEEAGDDQEVINKLGKPAAVASQILADYAVKDLDEYPDSPKKGIHAIWFIILAILASPIALPLSLLLFVPLILVFTLGFAFIVVMVSLIFGLFVGGGFSVISGFIVIFQHFPTAIFFIGIGLVLAGIAILLVSPLFFVTKKGFTIVATWMKHIFHKLSKKWRGEA